MSLIQTAAKPSSPLNTFLGMYQYEFAALNVTDAEGMALTDTVVSTKRANQNPSTGKYDPVTQTFYAVCDLPTAQIIAFDASDTEDIIELSSSIAPATTRGFDLDPDRGLLFVVGGNSFYVFDVSNPELPSQIGSTVLTNVIQVTTAWDVAYDPVRQVCVVVGSDSNGRAGVVNVATPASPAVEVVVSNAVFTDSVALALDTATGTGYLSKAFAGGAGEIASFDYSAITSVAVRDQLARTAAEWNNSWALILVPERNYLIPTCFSSSGVTAYIVDISDPDSLAVGASLTDADIGPIAGGGYDFNRDALFLFGANASGTAYRIASYDVPDINTITRLQLLDWS